MSDFFIFKTEKGIFYIDNLPYLQNLQKIIDKLERGDEITSSDEFARSISHAALLRNVDK